MTIEETTTLIDDLVDTNSTTYPLARKIRSIGRNLDKLVNLILENDPAAIFDDPNYADLAEGTLTLTNGQTVYNLAEDENFADVLYVTKVFVKDSVGNYYELNRYGTNDANIASSLKQNTAFAIFNPQNYFRQSGKRIILGFTPNYTASVGIYIYFQRAPKHPTVSDTSMELGIPSTYHQLVALMCAYDYARAKTLENRNDLLVEIREERESLGLHIDNQEPNKRTQIIGKRETLR